MDFILGHLLSTTLSGIGKRGRSFISSEAMDVLSLLSGVAGVVLFPVWME